jgi:uncharacterized membrane protein YeiH
MAGVEPFFPLWLEIAAMGINGAYGASIARHRQVPIAGTLLAGVTVGLGGGMARDALLGTQAIAISNPYLLPSVLAASLLGALIFYRLVAKDLPNLIVHGIAMGFLVSMGCQKAMSLGVPPLSAIFCGILTASVGGMAVDVMTNARPAAFSQAHWFITTLALGTTLYYILSVTTNFYIAVPVTVIVTAFLFSFSTWRNWPSPVWPNQSQKQDNP